MRKVVLGLGIAALLAFGAFGQVAGAPVGSPLGREVLTLLWINALELTPAQMKEILNLVDGLMPLRDEIVAIPEKLHEDLLKFTGKPQELKELLVSYRKELREKLQTLKDEFIDGLKKILTVAQWERLVRRLPMKEETVPSRRFSWRGPPKPPHLPMVGVDLLRGLKLVRFLPDLREALAAKLKALGN